MEILVGLGMIALFIAYGLYRDSERNNKQGHCEL